MVCCAVRVSSSIDADKLSFFKDRYQFPDDVRTHFVAPDEWCCSPRSLGIDIYESFILAGLRFPRNAFTKELFHRQGIAPSKLNPNGWRIIVAMQLLWREFSEGNFLLNVDEFLLCYKLVEIPKSLGFFQFSLRYKTFMLIMSLSLFDREWKSEFFFVYGFWTSDPIKVGIDTAFCTPYDFGPYSPIMLKF